ncbi:anti-sigma factor RsbA family regulatory protein [Actinoplanes sp. CA-030573]|uniref:anti-sigma factor RsbA family regulatory protein n=1 Tax=Actinoplanes sp. CA-030573 TaxID=3239898 RepID=UPI003D94F700
MRTGAAAGHIGYYHEAVCYDSAEHLLGVVVPFLLDGIEAGEPSIVALGELNAALVRSALPADSKVVFLTGGEMYARPATAIRSYRKLLADHVSEGAAQIRIIGEVTSRALGPTWDWWARYESAINHAYDEFPLWSMCAYDVRVTPGAVLDDVLRTHPRTALPDGSHPPNRQYIDPVGYLSVPRPPVPDPVQLTGPRADLTDPTPAEARLAVHAAGTGLLSADDLDDLVVAASETVTNARRHGRGPIRMRLWTAGDRVVITVTDAGRGPRDPFAGLLPGTNDNGGGLGLWITHQSCSHVSLDRGPDGFTVRLTGGVPL